MKRFFSLIFVLAAAFFLAGCETNPVIPEAKATPIMPATATGQAPKSALEMEYEIRKMEIELETTREMAMIKFTSESKSEFARGMAVGMMNKRGAGDGGYSPRRTSVVDAALAEKRQADALQIRREELAAQNSTFNKAMRVVEVGKDLLTFKWGINYRLDDKRLNNDQERYRLDNYRGIQQDAYGFASKVVDKGPYFFSLPAGSQPVAEEPVAEEPVAGQ